MGKIQDRVVGQTFGPFVRDYSFRDLELFALGMRCRHRRQAGSHLPQREGRGGTRIEGAADVRRHVIVDSRGDRTIDYGYNYADRCIGVSTCGCISRSPSWPITWRRR